MDSEVPVEVFSGTIWEASFVKSMLENEGILVFLKDEITGTLAPWYTAGGGAGSVKVVVSFADKEKALKIIRDFEKSRNENEDIEDDNNQNL